MIKVTNIKKDFPIFERQINGNKLSENNNADFPIAENYYDRA